jgi:hypothetical protein
MKPRRKPYRFLPAPKRMIVASDRRAVSARCGVCSNTLGRQYEENAYDGRLFCGVRISERGERRGHASADGEDLLRSVQGLLLPRHLSRRRLHHPLRQLLPARMGARCRADRSKGAVFTPRLLSGDAAEHAADAVHRMALWRHDLARRDAAELDRQPVDGSARQHQARRGDERQPHPDLWLDQRGRQPLEQLGPWRQLAGGL